MQSDEIEAAALALAPDARLRLTHALVRSLESADTEMLRGLWLNEAERRDAEMDGAPSSGSQGNRCLLGFEPNIRNARFRVQPACRTGVRGGC